MTNFLPDKYEIPSANTGYMKLKTGENRFRVLSSAIIGWESWTKDDEGNRKPRRWRMDEEINVEKWEKDNIDKALLGIVEEKSFKTGDFFMDLRVAVAGSRFTPPINDSIFILGKKETLARLKKAI